MAPGRELCVDDAEVVPRRPAFLRDCVDVAAAVGSAPVVAGPIYASVGPPLATSRRTSGQAVLRRAARGCGPLRSTRAERGVKLAIEPLIRYETSLINTVEQALEVVDGRRPPGAAACCSTPTT